MRLLRRTLAAWLIAALALAGQLAGAMALPQIAASGSPSAICSAGHQVPDQGPAVPPHHDCALCPACAAIHFQAVLLTPAPVPSSPPVLVAAPYAGPPPARAPPSHRGRVPPPRGPPAFA
jgi:hypothetical protein